MPKPCEHDSRPYYERLIEPLRAVARDHGYALSVHGTLKRDIDLIAVPWVHAAATPWVLAEAVRAEAERVVGYAQPHPYERARPETDHNPCHEMGCPGAKPHGRLVFCYHLVPTHDGPYIDLSVTPRVHDDDRGSPVLTKWVASYADKWGPEGVPHVFPEARRCPRVMPPAG